MKMVAQKASASSRGNSGHMEGRASTSVSTPAWVQRRAMPASRPARDLLALQRMINRRSRNEEQAEPSPAQIHESARVGTSGPSGPLPFLESIQRSFGAHDLGDVRAHTGPSASAGAQAMGAEAFTVGNSIAFAGEPSLHTAAHEAAHAIQQRAGVQLAGGVGKVGDPYERHADAVADLVVQGRSAEALLSTFARPKAEAVQREVAEEDELAVQQEAAEEEEEEAVVQSKSRLPPAGSAMSGSPSR